MPTHGAAARSRRPKFPSCGIAVDQSGNPSMGRALTRSRTSSGDMPIALHEGGESEISTKGIMANIATASRLGSSVPKDRLILTLRWLRPLESSI
eukprot:3133025-Pyramimonas_sp.AAC.1